MSEFMGLIKGAYEAKVSYNDLLLVLSSNFQIFLFKRSMDLCQVVLAYTQ